MGDGNVGIKDWAEQYKALCPNVPFTLRKIKNFFFSFDQILLIKLFFSFPKRKEKFGEIITGSPPRVLNYLEDDFWSAFPNARASEFACFERLVRKGLPFMGTMVVVGGGDIPPEYRAAQIAQQRFDLERSVKYCREVLGVGE